MDKLRKYKIAFRGLGEGKHSFKFELDSAFFNCFEATEGTLGTVDAVVVIVKSSLLMEVKIEISGTVRVTCDRCLGNMFLPVKGEMSLYVKQGEPGEGNDDDFIVLSPEDDFIDLSSFLYETYMLYYPIRAVHPAGGCDKDMEDVLGEYITDEENKPTDPRWDELKKLINN